MLTVAFDGICFLGNRPTGVGRAFATGLAAYAANHRTDCVLLLPNGVDTPTLPGVRIAPAPTGRWLRQLWMPRLLRDLRANVLHSSVAAVPLRAPCPTLATVHDLPWLHAEAEERSLPWRRWATRRALQTATLVLAPSTMTQRDAAGLVTTPTKVRLVPHGTAAPEPIADPNARDGPFLVLGDDRPRKNRERLVAAHALARQRAPSLPALQFVGPADGYVDEAAKTVLLQHCRAVVHVAKFEGFGLPVLEGLAHEAPVLASDLPPHREIAGEAALFVPANDTEAIAAALVQIHREPELRARLVAAGRARAAAFRPATLASRWWSLHREVAG
jgi:glycosyltransferase involved in cell wall biosynthesis